MHSLNSNIHNKYIICLPKTQLHTNKKKRICFEYIDINTVISTYNAIHEYIHSVIINIMTHYHSLKVQCLSKISIYHISELFSLSLIVL